MKTSQFIFAIISLSLSLSLSFCNRGQCCLRNANVRLLLLIRSLRAPYQVHPRASLPRGFGPVPYTVHIMGDTPKIIGTADWQQTHTHNTSVCVYYKKAEVPMWVPTRIGGGRFGFNGFTFGKDQNRSAKSRINSD